MSNTVIKIKRTSVAGRAANSTTLTNPGELALNMTDGIMYSTNGSVVFAIGANNTNVNVSNTLTVKAISANGSNGTSGHVLHSNGTATYWAADDQGVTSVATGNGLTGGTITTTGTISVIANNGLSANATGIYVVPGNGLIASNSTGVHVGQGTGVTVNSTTVAVNASYIATISSNNASFLGGTAAASYQLNSTLAANVATLASNSATYANASITNTFTVGTSTYFVSNGNVGIGNTTPAHKLRVQGDISLSGGIHANGSLGTSGQVLTSNGTTAYWASGSSANSVTVVSQQFTTNGTANTFTVSGGYYPNAIEVYLNGVKQIPGVDVDVSSGSTVVFQYTPANNQTVDVFGFDVVGEIVPGGTVTSITAGTGLSGGTITISGTLSVNSSYIATIASNSATYANGSITNTFTVGTSTYFVSNGNVGIGISSPYTNLTISNNVNGSSVEAVSSSLLHIVNESENATRMVIDQYGSAGAPNLIQRKARGTPASPSALLEGDVMLNNAGFGRGSTGWSSSARAQMLFVADENWSDTNQGSRIIFSTANNNTTSVSEKLRITANGDVGIGTTTPTAKLDVNGIIQDSKGDVRTLVLNSQTTSYTLVENDHGKIVSTNTTVIIPASVFTQGQNITVYNDSASDITINTTSTGVTCYLAGSANTSSRTLAQRGLATIVCVASSNTFVISGAGLS